MNQRANHREQADDTTNVLISRSKHLISLVPIYLLRCLLPKNVSRNSYGDKDVSSELADE